MIVLPTWAFASREVHRTTAPPAAGASGAHGVGLQQAEISRRAVVPTVTMGR